MKIEPPLIPQLFGFTELFLPPKNGRTEHAATEGEKARLPKDAAGDATQGVERNDAPGENANKTPRPSDTGIPFGTTLLLSGPPGAGKTTFALSLARALMKKPGEVPTDATSGPQKSGRSSKFIVYYLSSEIGLERLRQVFSVMDWFPDSANQEGRLFQIDSEEPDADTFYSITPEPEVDRPVPSPEELVNSIFSRIAKSLSPSEGPREDRKIIVIVDSVTALLKGCATESDERRHTHEILHRLRSVFSREQLALTVLLAEQETALSVDQRTSCVEDYLAEIVFRLYQRAMPLGRRVRILEILKSQGVNMLPGDHTWQIVTHENCNDLFRHEVLRMDIRGKGQERKELEKWGTVAIFPRVRLYPRIGEETRTNVRLDTGTEGLDEMLRAKPTYWLSNRRMTRSNNVTKAEGSLSASSITLVAGPLGAGKTQMCMQFLLRDAIWKFKEAHKNKESGSPPPPPPSGPLASSPPNPESENRVSILVSFDLAASQAASKAWEHWIVDIFGEEGDGPWGKESLRKQRDGWLAVLDFTQSQFDLNRMVAHVKNVRRILKPARMVFDGLSEWLTAFDQAEAAKVMEALMVMVAEKAETPRPTIFMTYELSLSDDPLAPQAFGVNTDNVVVVRQVNIQDEIRKIIYVPKATNSENDASVRELVFDRRNHRLRVLAGLDSFAGLLHGRSQPAKVLLQLFQENLAEKGFNDWTQKRLERIRNLSFKSLDFTRSEIGKTLEDTDSQTRFPPADLKLLSVDEWWLSQKFSTRIISQEPLLDLKELWDTKANPLAPSWDDFWLFELEKTGPDNGGSKRYAVPAYMDYGMFCVNPRCLRDARENPQVQSLLANGANTDAAKINWLEALGESYGSKRSPSAESLGKIWRGLLSSVPRVWVKSKDDWFDGESQGTIVHFAKTILGSIQQDQDSPRWWGFSFDMGTRESFVGAIFEFAWAFGASEDFLAAERQASGRGPLTARTRYWTGRIPAGSRI